MAGAEFKSATAKSAIANLCDFMPIWVLGQVPRQVLWQ